MSGAGGGALLRGRVVALTDEAVILVAHGERAGEVVSVERADRASALAIGDIVTMGAMGKVDARGGIARVAKGPGVWPPDRGAAGADLGRFDAARWSRLRRRAEILGETRRWFGREGFLEVETPILVASAGTETHLDPVAVEVQLGPGAARETRWLITSPEYAMKRLLAAGAGPIWQLTKVFRDGERGKNHRPEFSMLEWYRPFVEDYERLMSDCESLLVALNGGSERLRWGGRDYDLGAPWPRRRFFDLLRERADIARPEELDADAWMFAWVDRVERTLGLERPELVIEWPAPLASLSRKKASDPRVAERFELYLGTLELANAFAELVDAGEQRARCLADNAERRLHGKREMPLDEEFLGALEVGMPPSVGIALGFDRLVMILCDAQAIDDVMAF